MKIVGITGGIGSGKTTVCKVFEQLGIPVYNADNSAKRLLDTDSILMNNVCLLFGNNIYVQGKLDRTELASIVFSDTEKLRQLNELVHPTVATDFKQWTDRQNGDIVIKEAAILFETGGYKALDTTILIHAPENIRIERVMKRDGVSSKEVKARMNNQWPEQRKMELADHIIENHNGNLIIPQVLRILETLRI